MFNDKKLTKNFRLFEFIHSDIAWQFDKLRDSQIDASNDTVIVNNLTKVAEVLQDVRNSLELPIYINSGYRSQSLNDKLREMGYSSHPRSYHLRGLAADVRGKDINTTRKIWNHAVCQIAKQYPNV